MSTPSQNILSGELKPQSFGAYIDALIITNMRMWHAQEGLYELDVLDSMTKDQMFSVLKKASWLNIERTKFMDGTDASLVEMLERLHPGCGNRSQRNADQETIWEKV
jgi:hypothetical protein